jgi:rare lipoprotein A
VIRQFFLVFAMLSLVGCTQTQLAAHTIKNLPGNKRSVVQPAKGLYKVGNPYKIEGTTYIPSEKFNHSEQGISSWYGPGFHGKRTANGEIFNKYDLTAAHRTLQMPSLVRVTNLENGRSIVLRVNDRGPFARGRVLDVSERAAELLGYKNKGTAKIRVDVMEEESRILSEAARQGLDTRGAEIAYNRDGKLPISLTSRGYIQTAAMGSDVAKLQTVRVHNVPVAPTNIFVQLGAFSNPQNAQALQAKLATKYSNVLIKNVTAANGTFYRVRVGPLMNVPTADQTLKSVVDLGYQTAMIVVD